MEGFERTLKVLSLCIGICIWASPEVSIGETSGSKSGSEPAVRRALLIGISAYQQVPSLPGSINDVKIIHQVLTTRFGFSEKHIHHLINGAATREGIIEGLKALIKEAEPADIVYIHYSGHGSQVEDLNGDETEDGLDETLVPFDGRTEGIADITDDELEALFSQIQAGNVVIVLDSCHSGRLHAE